MCQGIKLTGDVVWSIKEWWNGPGCCRSASGMMMECGPGIAECTWNSVQQTVNTEQFTLNSVHCSVNSVQWTVYTEQWTPNSLQWIVNSVQCTLYSNCFFVCYLSLLMKGLVHLRHCTSMTLWFLKRYQSWCKPISRNLSELRGRL